MENAKKKDYTDEEKAELVERLFMLPPHHSLMRHGVNWGVNDQTGYCGPAGGWYEPLGALRLFAGEEPS